MPRDLVGYGPSPPHAQWPGGARIAVQFVLNIEEGAESSIVNGDDRSEAYLHELAGRPAREGERDWSVESLYEYGARAGVWRLLGLFRERGLPLTAFATGRALELHPELGRVLQADGHEVAGHGYRWIDHRGMPPSLEREHIQRTRDLIEAHCGVAPVGWYTGRVSDNTRRLLREDGRLLYLSDGYSDDLPYWLGGSTPQLMIPYSLLTNDMRYLLPHGVACGAQFLQLLKDSFDLLWREGEQRPKLMSVGLHPRISGHPERALALARFLDYLRSHEAVWICRRAELARHWAAVHPGRPN